MTKPLTPAEVFAGRARKYNHYEQSDTTPGHSCATCRRRQYGHPYTCIDGWPCGNPKWQDRGASCLNWKGDPKAPVD